MVSVEALAFYSVAFTFANMALLFSAAMSQALIPAFSQLQTSEKRRQYHSLFARGIRLNMMWLLPVLAMMFVIARPFFTLWAGEQFGIESTLPFYILLGGLFFNILAHVPHAAITASGRTDLFARLYWIELLFYAAAAFFLISNFGIVGAAAAWTLRVMLDAVAIIYLSRRHADVSFGGIAPFTRLAICALALAPAVILAAINNYSVLLIALVPVGVAIYTALIWRTVVDSDEKKWIGERYRKLLGRA
jgi:O-antigen/teichoic acid export membrane protein